MKILIHILPYFFAFLFGVFDAAQTVRKDNPARSVFWVHTEADWDYIVRRYRDQVFRDSVLSGETKFDRFDLWYVGGNQFYSPPRFFWTSDFWHTMKNLWVLTISAIGLSCLGVGFYLGRDVIRLGWQKRHLLYLLYVFLYWAEGATFSFFYHTALVR